MIAQDYAQLNDETWFVEPRRQGAVARAKEVWAYRRLLRHFATQAVKGMYQRMKLGWLWLFIRPLFPVVIGTVVFGGLLEVPSDGVPYFLFFLVGNASWMLLEKGLLMITRCMSQNRKLLRSVYFPRIILPVAYVMPALIEQCIYLGLIVSAIFYYGITSDTWYFSFGPHLLGWVAAGSLTSLLVISVGLWTSVLDAGARDVRYTLRYLMRFWFFVTPVIYPISRIPESWRWVANINPMTGLTGLYKWGMLGISPPEINSVLISLGWIVVLFASGVWFFNKAEEAAVDQL